VQVLSQIDIGRAGHGANGRRHVRASSLIPLPDRALGPTVDLHERGGGPRLNTYWTREVAAS
jgi:hypothetical protein